ncbi:MAG: hypothetical protein FWE23_01685 [Chitinivibrionia bacterium]|nr:hypothetical protein [Chitinivibrionia bacterium]
MGRFIKILAAVMFVASVVCGQIDWSANRITISTAEELHEFRDTVNAGRNFAGQTVLLLNDIDLNGNQGNQWLPIGPGNWHSTGFQGVFNGNGYSVEGVFINQPGKEFQGFFGVIGQNATVMNIGVCVNITASRWVGGLAAINSGTIENSYVVGNVSGIPTSETTALAVGGLVGDNYFGIIKNSWVGANIKGFRSVGGIVGGNLGNATIINSYAIGNVEGEELVGGLVGDFNTIGTITNSFSLSGEAPHWIGRIASNDGFRSMNQLRQQSTFTDWCFYTIWNIDENINNGFPFLHRRTKLPENAIQKIETQIFTNSPITPGIVVKDGETVLRPDIDYEIIGHRGNTNIGKAFIIVRGKGDFSGTIEAPFGIAPEGAILLDVQWCNEVEFVFNGAPQSPTASIAVNPNNNDVFVVHISGARTNVGQGQARASLADGYSALYRLRYYTRNFDILPKVLTVDWDTNTAIIFNRQAQVPNATARDEELDIYIQLDIFHNLNRIMANNINVGEYSVVAMIRQDNRDFHINYRLKKEDVERTYEIEHRPITILLEADQNAGVNSISGGAEKDTIVVIPSLFADSNNLKNIILGLVDFDNFVGDDDISVFGSARPTVKIIDPEAEIEESSRFGRSDDLVRYRLYLLRIETEGMFAENYQIGATEFFIRTEEFLPNFIRQNTSRDSRYGILLENTIVSDFARISVITPEQATVNLAIFDNLGNVVFSADGVGAGFARPENRTNGDLGGQTPPLQNAIVWNLTNQSGRFVGNGTYLIIVEATGISGRRFTYSARLGVSR